MREFIHGWTDTFLENPRTEEIVESAVPDARRFPELRADAIARFRRLARD